ncbi:Uma2 family endonuclease [Actinomadura alba]|uniref:Uma2 family endonuclease n=1 Tax=Actinomadura alba TaxID=406431 RepID=A0ABR7LL09_9ACTN|nr:Uma2 family endonuclease [Actinomadura alba]MBC6465175.1 Uma2 family endonuclease [Actinomadura alba]
MADPASHRPTLREIHESMEVPGHRVELIGGRIIVSPVPQIRHGEIVFWLGDQLQNVCAAKGWSRLPQTTLDMLATDERIVPDVLVYPREESIAEAWLVPAARALLVVEIVSPSSRRTDYEDKCVSCAKNGIPMYLIIDPYDATLTLCTEPSEKGYRLVHSVDVGDKLDLPEPFGITLDTGTLPIKAAES